VTAVANEALGRTFGSYLLGRRVGAGGMAVVYAARQQGPHGVGRVVALKVLSIGSETAARESFKREANIATRLEHANVVRTYEIGEQGGELYIAMELVSGASLSRARQGPVPLAIALRIASDVLRGLHAAHELHNVEGMPLGLVHQDVTPQNILVGYDGVTKLLDFGVARLGAIDTSRTDTIRGKPSYLAPEQLEGGGLDRRVDVFALGIVLFEVLSGERLFARDSVARTYQAVLIDDIPDVRARRPEVPAPIAAVVSRALSRPAAGRFSSAEEMRVALTEARIASGIPEATNDTVADWVKATCPPAFSVDVLEREILESLPERATIPDPGALAAARELAPPVPSVAAPASGSRRRGRAFAILGALVLMALVIGGVALQRRRVADVSPSLPPSASAGPLASASPGAAPDLGSLAPPLSIPSSSSSSSAASEVTRVPSVSSARLAAQPKRSLTAGSASAAPAPAPSTPQPDVDQAASRVASAAPVVASRLSVYSNVWGHVLVDGKDVGTSPLRAVPVAPGSHAVTVRTEDGEQTKTVQFDPSGDVKLKFVF
jgi:serine/threonine-protein kinase